MIGLLFWIYIAMSISVSILAVVSYIRLDFKLKKLHAEWIEVRPINLPDPAYTPKLKAPLENTTANKQENDIICTYNKWVKISYVMTIVNLVNIALVLFAEANNII